nr:MAG TPA: hypothetical protein [Caudoviricetes sp.]
MVSYKSREKEISAFLFCLPGIGNQGLFRFPFTLRAYFDCLSEASWKVR